MASSEWETLLRVNVLGTTNLFELLTTVYKTEAPPVLMTSSSAVYGEGEADDCSVAEHCPLRPMTPYGVSKATQEMVAGTFVYGGKLPVMIVRPFNLIGPEQPPAFVASSIARQIAQAEARREPARVQLGRLDSQRDFVDVRDAANLYLALLNRDFCGDAFNCGTGVMHSIGQVVEMLRDLAKVDVSLEQQTALFRGADVRAIRADLTKVAAAVGWRPTISFQQSLRDLLTGWRKQVGLERCS
jgi:GDP-4-dehydro-6-deoxy-D-mannose reductase